MPTKNKIAAEENVNSLKHRAECREIVEALVKVTACYKHLAVNIGGSSDCFNLRDELRKTREKVQELALTNRNKLTTALRDKTLSKEDRTEMDRLWVIFSSSLELFHMDMCKVYELGQNFTFSVKESSSIQSGMTGPTSAITARALSIQNLKSNEAALNVDKLEQNDLVEQIRKVDTMINDMEMKVNVLRWTVEAKGEECCDLVSNDTSSLALLTMEENDDQQCCDKGQLLISTVLIGVVFVAMMLSICVL
ncbi:regulator of G-protein signaling 9-binding protein B-like [Protopterus annectens]|uniref:regulator of G-protein signaling 9-binding protein B-like n=1 Tax=Protopterus annectens TaxID=7888 RepID=UPI001CFB2C84|nr:regulator of G-protein signaling 9-binding protein B-like [Protopterus annectens]